MQAKQIPATTAAFILELVRIVARIFMNRKKKRTTDEEIEEELEEATNQKRKRRRNVPISETNTKSEV